jgi:hypothetical protein
MLVKDGQKTTSNTPLKIRHAFQNYFCGFRLWETDAELAWAKRTRRGLRASKRGKEDAIMPEKETLEAAKRDLEEGKSPSTAAGEFVREEIDHVREGKHGARSAKQAIAIGLSKARRAGIPLGAPNPKTTSAETRKKAAQDSRRGEVDPVTSEEGSTKRGKARLKAMKREPKSSVSHAALSRQAKSTARKRGQTVHRKSR